MKIKKTKAKVAALPFGHPAISTNDFLVGAKAVAAKQIIPIHYDIYERDINELVRTVAEYEFSLEVLVINNGDEIDI